MSKALKIIGSYIHRGTRLTSIEFGFYTLALLSQLTVTFGDYYELIESAQPLNTKHIPIIAIYTGAYIYTGIAIMLTMTFALVLPLLIKREQRRLDLIDKIK